MNLKKLGQGLIMATGILASSQNVAAQEDPSHSEQVSESNLESSSEVLINNLLIPNEVLELYLQSDEASNKYISQAYAIQDRYAQGELSFIERAFQAERQLDEDSICLLARYTNNDTILMDLSKDHFQACSNWIITRDNLSGGEIIRILSEEDLASTQLQAIFAHPNLSLENLGISIQNLIAAFDSNQTYSNDRLLRILLGYTSNPNATSDNLLVIYQFILTVSGVNPYEDSFFQSLIFNSNTSSEVLLGIYYYQVNDEVRRVLPILTHPSVSPETAQSILEQESQRPDVSENQLESLIESYQYNLGIESALDKSE